MRTRLLDPRDPDPWIHESIRDFPSLAAADSSSSCCWLLLDSPAAEFLVTSCENFVRTKIVRRRTIRSYNNGVFPMVFFPPSWLFLASPQIHYHVSRITTSSRLFLHRQTSPLSPLYYVRSYRSTHICSRHFGYHKQHQISLSVSPDQVQLHLFARRRSLLSAEARYRALE